MFSNCVFIAHLGSESHNTCTDVPLTAASNVAFLPQTFDHRRTETAVALPSRRFELRRSGTGHCFSTGSGRLYGQRSIADPAFDFHQRQALLRAGCATPGSSRQRRGHHPTRGIVSFPSFGCSTVDGQVSHCQRIYLVSGRSAEWRSVDFRRASIPASGRSSFALFRAPSSLGTCRRNSCLA